MPELLTVWLVLAFGLAAAWCLVRATYLRGFADGRREERERWRDAPAQGDWLRVTSAAGFVPGMVVDIDGERGVVTDDVRNA